MVISPVTARGQVTRGPRDFIDRGSSADDFGGADRYGNRYRNNVFDDDTSFSEAYPYVPRTPPPRIEPPQEKVTPRPRVSRYRGEAPIRNDYAGLPIHRHYYGGVDRYDSPGYLDDAGRASARSNGYARRGVEEFRDGYGRGVRTNDVYPLLRDVNPRRYRGRMLNGAVTADDQDTQGANETEDFVRSELAVRPGANLRVSSTGTYTFKNWLDQGNQVHARFRQPVHKRYEYQFGP